MGLLKVFYRRDEIYPAFVLEPENIHDDDALYLDSIELPSDLVDEYRHALATYMAVRQRLEEMILMKEADDDD